MGNQIINIEAIQEYSKSFSETVLRDVEQVNGAQLLKLCSVEQINLLMVKNLYQSWEEELDQLKSPYFDYKADDVKQALNNLMNVLSRNIKIDVEHLKPLLARSVEQFLVLAADPRAYFLEYFLAEEMQTIDKSYLEKIQKFIKVNHQILSQFLDKINDQNQTEISRTDYVDRIKIIIAELKESFDPLANICQQLSKVSPISEAQIFSTIDEVADLPAESKKEVTESDDREVISINQRFNQEKTSLNQRLKNEPKKTLADTHRDKKLANLKESLTLNQQFMFVKELFSGDEVVFNQALDHLESCSSYQDATNFLKRSYSFKNQWDLESNVVKNFFEILSRRY
ncbi:MAG: hypothetical protein ACR2MX_03460 [Cyclobacteriaceae bacterium]